MPKPHIESMSSITSTETGSIDYDRINVLVNTVVSKYKDNKFMEDKIANYISTELLPQLTADYEEYTELVARNKWLDDQTSRISASFMNTHRFFYISNTERFILYDSVDYSITSIDKVLHTVLCEITNAINASHPSPYTEITNNTVDTMSGISDWKQRTTNTVMREIRDNHLIDTIPESATIQNVISSFYPTVFPTRDEAKFFLTSIGDMMLNKHTNRIFLADTSFKQMVGVICTEYNELFGNNHSLASIKYKYHDHLYADCRILNVRNTPDSSPAIDCIPGIQNQSDIIRTNIINIISVALHYSKRHGDSDLFATSYMNLEDSDRIFFLRDNTQPEIIDRFIYEYIHKDNLNGENSSVVTQKDIGFLWKDFIRKCGIPNVIFSATLLLQLKSLFPTKTLVGEKEYVFQGITSKYLPVVSSFLEFWDRDIVVHDESSESTETIYELEIDELVSIYRGKCHSKRLFVGAENIIQLITHFYPSVRITNDKYVCSVEFREWNKTTDIYNYLEYIKHTNQEKLIGCGQKIPISNLYIWYIEYVKKMSLFGVTSKSFFEQTVCLVLKNHVHNDNKHILISWLTDL